jgi:transposase
MASSLIKEEKEIHRQAFEYYYALGSERNLREVAKEFNKSLTSVHNWSVSFDWKSRIELRDAETSRMLEKKTNETIVEIKAKYHTFLKAMIAKAIEDFKAKRILIETPLDIIRVMQMDLELMGEGDSGKSGMLQEFTDAIDAGRKLYEEQLRQAQAQATKEE